MNYENDFFSGTDRDYTQGIYLEYVHPALAKFPLMHLLLKAKKSSILYGVALEHNGYTPNIIADPAVQYGDRPYAGVILLKTFATTVNSERRERIVSILSTGLIGPWAGGEGMQRGIHHWIHYTQPEGWGNQVKNDVALNYQVNYEKEFVHWKDYFSLSSYLSARLGTLSTKATAGVTAILGNFCSPFVAGKDNRKKKFEWYIYDQPSAGAIGYDATLQGGLFHRSSVYTISAKNVNRFTFINRWGLVIMSRKICLEYYQSGPTQEFSTSVYHRSGGLQIGFRL